MPSCTMGFTVVGKPAAAVTTSSPGISRRSPNSSAVNVASASRFADEPELTRLQNRTPTYFANFFSNVSPCGPRVNQKSNALSTSA